MVPSAPINICGSVKVRYKSIIPYTGENETLFRTFSDIVLICAVFFSSNRYMIADFRIKAKPYVKYLTRSLLYTILFGNGGLRDSRRTAS